MHKLKDYEEIVGEKKIKQISDEFSPLVGKHIVHLNSTYYGGGVAELLTGLVSIFNDMGVSTGWRLLKGNPDFFSITKKFHNALQGDRIHLTAMKKKIYEKVNKSNADFTHISHHDAVIVHDPQPLPMIKFYKKTQPWIWRCHIDLSRTNRELWNYLKNYIHRYDKVIVSKNTFKKKKLGVPQEVIYPSIDPLNHKNQYISDSTIKKYLKKFEIETDKPIISQISRFDKWKDPVGVIQAYKKIKKEVDCRLVLLGSMATDDPEGQQVYRKVIEMVKDDEDIKVINFENDILVNVIQRASSVVIQKSLKEGFGLTVSEAMWKGTPVVASNVGGISLQVKNNHNGFLVNSSKECADKVTYLLKHPKKAEQMGRRGKEMVREKFIITRHVLDYVNLLKKHLITYKTNIRR